MARKLVCYLHPESLPTNSVEVREGDKLIVTQLTVHLSFLYLFPQPLLGVRVGCKQLQDSRQRR